jgi:histidine triad (HIT) family protein
VQGKIPAKTVYEDEDCIAFLDRMPRSRGMTLVVPKKHYSNFDEDFKTSAKLFESALKVAKMVKDGLQPKSVSLAVIASPKVPHFHVRIYPVYEGQVPLGESPAMEVSEEELEEVAEKIRSVKVEVEEKPKEKEPEEKRPKEEVYWIRRELEIA